MGDTKADEFRRHASLLFADLCDYTALNEVCDPEEVAAILERVRAEVDGVVARHGGLVNEWRGDGVLCLFGLPRATEEDSRRAVEAALEMHHVLRGLERQLKVPRGFEICLHSGIDSGLVFARERENAPGYELIGDAVNTAARLCTRAGRDEVWVTESTIASLKEFFDVRPAESLTLKGKKASVAACQVLSRSSVLTRFAASQRRGLTPLIGRDAAIARIHDSYLQALAGRLQVIGVAGSPGVGKTRMLEEFRRRLPDATAAFIGYSEARPDITALQPFVQVLRQAFHIKSSSFRGDVEQAFEQALRDFGPTLAAHRAALASFFGLAPLPTNVDNPDYALQTLLDALGAVMEVLVRRGPLVLMLDDWQWADDASRQALGNLLREHERSMTLVIVASRELGDPLLAEHPAIELSAFKPTESTAVVQALLPGLLDLGLTRALHERSGGNPLFLEELCRALRGEAVSGPEDMAGARVPATLQGILQARVERLPPRAAAVLQAAAVIGGEVDDWLLEAVAPAEGLSDALAVLAERDLVHAADGGHTLRFKHGTTRDVVYEAVRLPERRRLHRAAAVALAEHAAASGLPEPYEALAYHHAGAAEFELAARAAELAADRAAATSSLDRARQQYHAALDALEKLGLAGDIERRWIALVASWAAASLYNPEPEHLQLIERARSRALALGDQRAATGAEYWQGWFAYALGDHEAALQYWRSALQRAEESGDDRLGAQLYLNMAQGQVAACEYEQAQVFMERGLSEKRRAYEASRDKPASLRRAPLGFAYALGCKGLMHGDLGQFVEAEACFEEAFAALGASGHAVEGSCLGLLCMVQLLRGDFEQALETAERARKTAERVNGPYVFAIAKSVSGYARWQLQRDPGFVAEMLSGIRWMEGRGTGLYLSFNYGHLAEAFASAGDDQNAREYARKTLARSAQMDRIGEGLAYRTLARVAARASDLRAAEEYLRQAKAAAMTRRSDRELALTELERLRLTPAVGRPANEELVASLRRMGMTHHEREAQRLLGGTPG